jgi:hypothetical protein
VTLHSPPVRQTAEELGGLRGRKPLLKVRHTVARENRPSFDY